MPTAGTKPEKRVAAILSARGVRFVAQARIKVRGLARAVSADFYVPDRKLAIFVDGCFFHGHAHALVGSTLSTRRRWKIADTIARDARTKAALGFAGIRVLRVFECRIDAGRIVAALTGARS